LWGEKLGFKNSRADVLPPAGRLPLPKIVHPAIKRTTGMNMEGLKQFLIRHFEKILVATILAASVLGPFYFEDKTLLLSFYFLPVVIASYFLGKRLGVLAAFLSVLAVVGCIVAFPQHFLASEQLLSNIIKLSSWGGFLILTSYAVGSLYEQKEHQMEELKKAYVGILEILSKYIESKDSYTRGHSMRVSEYAKQIAIAMDLPRQTVETIRVAGLLHDIGKIEISGDVIRKAATLTPAEQELMNLHSERGGAILSKVGGVLKDVVPIVIAHHRYFEETLEPSSEVFKTIPLGARIIAVADAFDAMTSDRPYRQGKPPWEALQEIVGQAGQQFDPVVVENFRRVIGSQVGQI
jgi:putative nucleotidyltransferase with HDIG domain